MTNKQKNFTQIIINCTLTSQVVLIFKCKSFGFVYMLKLEYKGKFINKKIVKFSSLFYKINQLGRATAKYSFEGKCEPNQQSFLGI